MTSEKAFDREEIQPDWLMEQHKAVFARDIARLLKCKSEFIKVPCPACESDAASAAFEKTGYTFVTCDACGTLYMSPRPTAGMLTDYYRAAENYRFWAKQVFPATEQARREKVHRPRLARLTAYCERANAGRGCLVEIGPGYGSFLQLAAEAKAFQRIVAVNPDPEMSDIYRTQGIEVLEKSLERVAADADLESVDVIATFETIDHLFDPAGFLRAAHRILANNGLLVVSTPNVDGFDTLTLGPLSPAVDAEHLNLFNTRSLPRLLDRCGFAAAILETPGNIDVDIVRDAALNGDLDLVNQPLLKRILVTEWEQCGRAFQEFLVASKLSGHMWCVARKIGGGA